VQQKTWLRARCVAVHSLHNAAHHSMLNTVSHAKHGCAHAALPCTLHNAAHHIVSNTVSSAKRGCAYAALPCTLCTSHHSVSTTVSSAKHGCAHAVLPCTLCTMPHITVCLILYQVQKTWLRTRCIAVHSAQCRTSQCA
jgi:hypothetical protein